jgi:hypothetical protein
MLFSDAVGLTIIMMQMNSLVRFGEVIETAYCDLVRLMDYQLFFSAVNGLTTKLIVMQINSTLYLVRLMD